MSGKVEVSRRAISVGGTVQVDWEGINVTSCSLKQENIAGTSVAKEWTEASDPVGTIATLTGKETSDPINRITKFVLYCTKDGVPSNETEVAAATVEVLGSIVE